MTSNSSFFPNHEPQIRPPSTWTTALILTLLSTLYILYKHQTHPLHKIPGPFPTSLTRLWVFQKQRSLNRHQLDLSLHKTYGPIVRTSPNEVMVSSPSSYKIIYGSGSKFTKGSWYTVTGDRGWNGNDQLNFLPEMNMEKYRVQRRVIGPAYTMDAMKDYEGNIDIIIKRNIGIMRQRAGSSVDVDIFFNMFALDCQQMVTFSKTRRTVEANEDDGLITMVHTSWHFMHLMGFFPSVYKALLWYTHRIKTPVSQLLGIARRRVSNIPSWERIVDDIEPQKVNTMVWSMNETETRKEKEKKDSIPEYATDIAGKLFQIKASKPDILKYDWLANMCRTNFGAGVETIGITISTLIVAIVSHAGCQAKIHKEIDEAMKEGKLLDSVVPGIKDLQEKLPYLSACLAESMRLHSVIGMPLQRVVPEGGCTLEGHFLPAGTNVGIDPWVVSRDKSLYGEDAEEWRPERWLEYSEKKLRSLKPFNVSFGTGARSCPGKFLAQAIYFKIIPMIFINFEWRFSNPEEELVIQSTFTARLIKCMMEWKVRDEAKIGYSKQ